ncbi:DUF2071 domain-containing protein [Kitasatospora phosalacinea]|uniref:DUF2071 domain-containing protein n=1 Tax=Kitasatospora phosalacinea TaxID=2065 RepID=UPI0009E08D2D|nr:DUF2071 domain-containing protein [Kitasatospora phosalacinea]
MRTRFAHSLVLTYALPPQVLQPLLPPGLTLDTYTDPAGAEHGFAAALVDTRDLRPAFLPAGFGTDQVLTGYRIFTRFPTPQGRTMRGLKILRSDTDSRVMALGGNLLTRYHHRLARKAPRMVTHLLTLEGQLRPVGAALIAMGAFHIVLPRIIGWPADLTATSLLTRQVSYVHLFFIALTCALLGLLPLLLAPDLLAGSRLGTALLAAQTLFRGARRLFEFAVFPPRLRRGNRLRTAAHVALSVLWTWVTAVFTCALVTALRG